MPTRAPHSCPECRINLTAARRCGVCQSREERARGTTTERGYGYAHAKKRDDLLKRNPFCVSCEAKGQMIGAKVRDHIVPRERGGSDGIENEQGLCDTCHAVKRQAESRGRQMRVMPSRGLIEVGPLPPRRAVCEAPRGAVPNPGRYAP